MAINKVTEGMTGQAAADLLFNNDKETEAGVIQLNGKPGIKYLVEVGENGLFIGDENGNFWFKSSPEKTEYIGQVTREELDELKNNPVFGKFADAGDPNALYIGDGLGNYWFKSSPSGTDYVGKLKMEDILAAVGTGPEKGIFDSDIVQIIAYGQSLSVSGSGTTLDLLNTISFGGGVLTNYDPDDTAARDAYYAPGLAPMSSVGVESMKAIGRVLGQLIADVNKIPVENQDFQILVNAPGAGGISYSACANKTGIYYRRLIESVRRAQDFAIAEGKSYSVPALCWIQGENSADKAKSKAQVISDLTSLFSELNTDIKAITNQQKDIQFFVYQIASFVNNPPATVNMPLAHLELAETVENIHFGTAMYQYSYADAIHLTSSSYRRMASTFGAQIYHGIVLGQKRSPIVPLSYHVQESTGGQFLLSVKFFVPVAPLVFDTTQYAAQPNMGFSIKTGGGAEIITAVSLKRGETINILCSQNPNGLELEYAINGAAGGGNLRDSQGDKIKTSHSGVEFRVDNWAPIFRKTITI